MFRQYTSLIALAIASLSMQAQSVEDSVSLGVSYKNQSYYDLNQGEVKSVDNTNWDIAFDASNFGSAIRINGGKGVKLYMYPKGDSSAWSSFDTTGMSSWTELEDSDTSWYKTAFNSYESGVDVGWGNYSTVTHQVHGDSLYLVQLTTGEYKKLHIVKLAGGVYTFRHADLDGSNDKTSTLDKGNFSNKNFGYYSLSANKSEDREPSNVDWHLVFTSYKGWLSRQQVYYGVTGVLTNRGVEVAKAYPVVDPETYTDHSSFTFHHVINSIGYNWKSFNGMGFSLADSTCYFIKTVTSDIYRIVFTGFGGSANGNIKFKKENLTPSSIDGSTAIENHMVLYPNPAQGEVSLLVSDANYGEEIRIINMAGKTVHSLSLETEGFIQHSLSLEKFQSGIYFVEYQSINGPIAQKLVVK